MPLRACTLHGRPGCRSCGERARARAAATGRPYRGRAIERQMRQDVLETYGPACHYLAVDPDCPGGDVDPARFELAHVVAHADGGPFELENLRPAHPACNRRAGRGAPRSA